MIRLIAKCKHMVFLYVIAALLSSCNYMHQRKMVNIKIDPSNYGWYFIELHKDTVSVMPSEYSVRFKDSSRLEHITVDDYDNLKYRVYDPSGKDISSRMKIPMLMSTGRTFFHFYYPTDRELSVVKQWMPTDSAYNEIYRTNVDQLNKLLK